MVDGSSRLGAFVRILLPLVAPGPRRHLGVRVRHDLERVHLRERPAQRPVEPDGDGMALVLLRHEPEHRLGRPDGGVDADRDSRRRLLPARAAADRVRAHGRRRPRDERHARTPRTRPASCPGSPVSLRPTGSGASSTKASGASCSSRATCVTPSSSSASCRSVRVSPETVVCIDEEGGDVTRLEASTGSSVPGPLALGAVDDVELTARVARASADSAPCRRHHARSGAGRRHQHQSAQPGHRGALVRLGPGARLASRQRVRARSPGGRSRRLRQALPGPRRDRRSTRTSGCPVVPATLDELREVELAPFRAAIAAGTRADHDGPSRRAGARRRCPRRSAAPSDGPAARRARLHRHGRHRCARDAGGERDGRDGGRGRPALRRRRRCPLPRARHRRGPRRHASGRRSSRQCGRAGWPRNGSPKPQRESRHRTRQSLSRRRSARRSSRSGWMRHAAQCASEGEPSRSRARCSSSSSRDAVGRGRAAVTRSRRRSCVELGADVETMPISAGASCRRRAGARRRPTRDAAPSSSFVTSTATRGSECGRRASSRPATAESSSMSGIPPRARLPEAPAG